MFGEFGAGFNLGVQVRNTATDAPHFVQGRTSRDGLERHLAPTAR